jgi:hypothetical protein
MAAALFRGCTRPLKRKCAAKACSRGFSIVVTKKTACSAKRSKQLSTKKEDASKQLSRRVLQQLSTAPGGSLPSFST